MGWLASPGQLQMLLLQLLLYLLLPSMGVSFTIIYTCVAIFSFRGLWCNSEVESIVHDPFITKHGGSGEKCYGKCC